MEKIDKIYEKINGSYFGLIGLCISISCIVISALLVLSADPTFSFFTYYLSDMGTVRNGAHIAFGVGMMVTSIFFFFFLIFLNRYFQKVSQNKRRFQISYIFVIMVALGLFIVGLIPYDVSVTLHRFLGTLPFFIGIILLAIIYTITELSFPQFPKIIIYVGFALIISSIIFLTFVISFTINPEVRKFPLSSFSQWVFFFIVIIWVLVHSLYTLKEQ